VIAFQTILRSGGVNAHVRKSRGRDIDAACGQLRRREQQKKDFLMQLRTPAILLLITLSLSLFTGCATLLRGNSQTVKFITEPPKATVSIDGTDHTAPVALRLKRNKPHIITVSAEGFQSVTFDLVAQWDGASLGNIIMPGGSVGFGIDTLYGADRSFNTLAKIRLNRPAGATTMHMYEYKGSLMGKDDYDREMIEQREYHAGRVY